MLLVQPWTLELSGQQSIWLDILHIVSPVLRAVCLPLGTMLIAASIVAKALETQRAADATPAYQEEGQPPHAP